MEIRKSCICCGWFVKNDWVFCEHTHDCFGGDKWVSEEVGKEIKEQERIESKGW